jgi:Serine dehydrogenase proteinase
MTPGDVLWFFFMFSALQPILKQRFLEASGQRMIAAIERRRNSRIILLVNRRKLWIAHAPTFCRKSSTY